MKLLTAVFALCCGVVGIVMTAIKGTCTMWVYLETCTMQSSKTCWVLITSVLASERWIFGVTG